MAELALPDPCVVLLVGAASAGKSTFAARHFPPTSILSSDAMREAIGGDAADQSATRPAFAALHRALERRLAAGRLTVVDATNLTAGARRSIRRVASRHGLPAVAIVLDLPPADVHARNAARPGRQVPATVVDRHLARLRAAVDGGELASEGYAAIVHIRGGRDADALVVRRIPSSAAGPP